MATFKAEIGNDRSGDLITVEAETAEEAHTKAQAEATDRNPDWTVQGVYALVSGDGVQVDPEPDLPDDGTDDDADPTKEVVDGADDGEDG